MGWCLQWLNGETQLSEHLDSACLAALEVSGAEPLPRGELVGRAQDRLVRVMPVVRYQLVRPARAETVRSEEGLWSLPVVLRDRVQHVLAAHAVPRHHVPTSSHTCVRSVPASAS